MADYSSTNLVRQVEATKDITRFRTADYCDAFEVRLPASDTEEPATWVLRGLTDTPVLVAWIARLFGRDEEPDTSSQDVVAGWRVVQSTPDLVELERTLPLMHVRAVGRKIGTSSRLFTSVLHYRRPILARAVWMVVGPGHRRMSKRLVAGTPSLETYGGRVRATELRRTVAADYADEFTLRLPESGSWTAETWARTMLGDAPDLAERLIWRSFLGFTLISSPGRHHVAGWPIVEASVNRVQLANSSGRMTGGFVITTAEMSVTLRTEASYESHSGRVIWSALSPIHRMLAPGLLRSAYRHLSSTRPS